MTLGPKQFQNEISQNVLEEDEMYSGPEACV